LIKKSAGQPIEKPHLLSRLARMGWVDTNTRGVASGIIRLQLPALSAQEGSFMPWDIPKDFDHYTRSIIESAGDIHHPGTRPWQAHPAGEILTGIHESLYDGSRLQTPSLSNRAGSKARPAFPIMKKLRSGQVPLFHLMQM
jgi:hypothetical protein